MAKNLLRRIIFPQSVILEKLSDYFAKRADEVEYGGCGARRGHYMGLPAKEGGIRYIFIQPLTKLELNLSFPLLDRIDDKYQISECLQMLTAFLAHPFGGERITKEKKVKGWDWRW